MTDLLLKANDITVTSSRITEHRDGSCFGHIDILAGDLTGDVEVSYDLEYSNPIENTFYSLGQYFENVEVKFTHFSAVIDDEETEDEEELETLKAIISEYIISKL